MWHHSRMTIIEPEGNSADFQDIKLQRGPRGLYVDPGGTVFALVRRSCSRDEQQRAGLVCFHCH